MLSVDGSGNRLSPDLPSILLSDQRLHSTDRYVCLRRLLLVPTLRYQNLIFLGFSDLGLWLIRVSSNPDSRIKGSIHGVSRVFSLLLRFF